MTEVTPDSDFVTRAASVFFYADYENTVIKNEKLDTKKEDAANESAPDDLVTSSTFKVTSLFYIVNKYYINQLS